MGADDASPPVPEKAPCLNECLCQHVLAVARARAERLGLTGDAAEDCALGFLVHLLRVRPGVLCLPDPAAFSDAWLFRCADNWARNVRRGLVRRQGRERPWPVWSDPESDTPQAWEAPDDAPLPETWLLRRELWTRIREAVAQLSETQQQLFVRHYVQEESIGELALASGRTPNAVRQALWALRQRLRLHLAQRGLGQPQAWEYLTILAASANQTKS